MSSEGLLLSVLVLLLSLLLLLLLMLILLSSPLLPLLSLQLLLLLRLADSAACYLCSCACEHTESRAYDRRHDETPARKTGAKQSAHNQN